MTDEPLNTSAGFPDETSSMFLLRWRGRQEGPYSPAAIEEKLAANQIGLLHEVLHKGKWVTLRDYFAERDAYLGAQREVREEHACRAREEAARQAKEREEQRQAELLAEERRRNDLLQANIADRQTSQPARQAQPILRKSHRAGTILTLAIVGLLVCGPLCILAWTMGDNDLREMDAGIMDNSGRSSTATGRSLGVIGTVLWIIVVIVLFTI